ncbi:TetR/AcrR family transcriptional regulator [Paenibacillus sp. XY044]|uniref:TetR/AcrR family transcriptional regulator n=1 Tax=Paenibacillus sp. XY044 TaxID=2026089 RepID=UPI000B98D266|nr:TetR/AcrR family transcriptional regulator [Paenibacillus sp. XY044]OZB95277.1 hypothetical protein CJP46_16490 [Paenibacillus sp. XY044]
MTEKPNSRESIVETATRLFAKQGYHGTGLNQIIKESHCPKGSLYYYFPEGKEELAQECILRIKSAVSDKWEEAFDRFDDPSQAIQHCIDVIAADAKATDFDGFIPLSFWNAVETSCISNNLREACQGVLHEWERVLTTRLQDAGLEESRSREAATVILSLLEGSLLIAQTNKDTVPMFLASKYVGILLDRLLSKNTPDEVHKEK